MSKLSVEEFNLQSLEKCHLDERGKIMNSQTNLDLILDTDPALQGVFRLDDRKQEIVVSDDHPFEWLNDTSSPLIVLASCLGHWLAGAYNKTIFESGKIERAIKSAAVKNPFDPIKDYLVSLEWDGTPRLEKMLTDCFGAKDLPIIREISKRWMISAVARTFNPGCLIEGMLVIYGKQGCGKTRGLFALAKEGVRSWSPTASREFSRDDKLSLHTMWIAVWDELQGMGKKEIDRLKGFLTDTVDNYRKPYAIEAKDHERRFVFCGSTNEKEILRDFTGDRRYYIVEVPRGTLINVDKIYETRDQLWAEAVELYKRGEPYYFSEEEKVRLGFFEYLSDFRDCEPWQECVDETIIPEFFRNIDARAIKEEENNACKFAVIQKAIKDACDKDFVSMPISKTIRRYLNSSKFNEWLEYKKVKLRNGTSPRLWVCTRQPKTSKEALAEAKAKIANRD